MRTKAEDWTYLELAADQVPTGVGHVAIAADSSYITLSLKSLRVVNLRKGLSTFYGAVHSWSSIAHLGEGRASFQALTTPAQLKAVEAKHLDRVIIVDRPLLGPLPYRGGGLELELGLFSVKSADLAGPFLDVLEAMSKAAGVTFVSAALPFIEPLAEGISLLTGSAAATILEIGISKQWEPTTGYYAILRAPRGTIRSKDVSVAADQRLTYKDGSAIRDYPYVVFAIEATKVRPNWFEIPELKKAFDELNDEVSKGHVQESEQALAVYRRACLGSPDLLYEDAKVTVAKVTAQVRDRLGAAQTAGALPAPLSPLETFSPFD